MSENVRPESEHERFGHDRIPGERDAETMTQRQPGAIGGRSSGADTPSPDPHHVMDDATIADRRREGGGVANAR